MTTKYATNFSETFPFSDTNFMLLLAASTALPITVPGTSEQVYRAKFDFTIGQSIWVKKNGTATLPSAGVATAVQNQELLCFDTVKYVQGGDTLSFISAGTPSIGVSLLLVQPQ